MAEVSRISGSNAIVRRVVRQTQDGMVTSVASALGHAARDMDRQLTATVREFGNAVSADRLRRRIGPVNQQLAEGARSAVASAYNQRKNIRENNNYRVGKAYNQRKTGMLAPALGSSQMIAATSERQISFINPDFLRREAPHWARLNFGAGGQGSAPSTFTLRVDTPGAGPQALVTIGATRTGSEPMLMPVGVWRMPGNWGQRGTGADDWFVPLRGVSRATIPTRGIEAYNFVDAGFKYLSRHVMKRYWDEFLDQAQSARSTLKVRPVDADAVFTYRSTRG